jgi:ABC-type bacteriocin/lantibiotic exporter with double-glycine peptidase domain
MWKVLKLPMDFFSQRMAGDILSRQSSNASVASTFINTFTPLILKIGMAIFYLIVMFIYSVILSCI